MALPYSFGTATTADKLFFTQLQTDLDALLTGQAAASDTAAGVIEIAIQSEQETGTDVVRAVTPGRQHFHPGHPKGWGVANTAGGVLASYNLTSVTDVGTGQIAFNWATDFSSADQNCSIGNAVTTGSAFAYVNAKAAGSTNMVGRDDAGALVDPTTAWHCIATGDQA